jgi:hypothetical protein
VTAGLTLRVVPAICVLAVAASVPAASAAVGVAYIDGGNIQVSTVDGATKATSDSSDSGRYYSAAQAPDGFVSAAAADGTSLKQC